MALLPEKILSFLTALAVGLIAGCGESGPCEKEMVEAFLTVPSENAVNMAWMSCDYPADLKKMLKDLELAAPEYHLAIVARMLGRDMSHFERICPESEEVFKAIDRTPADRKSFLLTDRCGLERQGCATREELSRTAPDRLLVGSLIHGWLKKQKESRAREICRHTLGLE